MQTKHITFDEIYDILAVRIIFEPKSPEEELNECFNIYVSISKIYKPHPDRLRDWVSHPKSNGYQALHVTLMSNKGQWIEVQIRSQRMDDVAEQGFAAHWKYKEGGGSEDQGELDKWLRTIKEILDDPQPDAMDFLDTIKLNLFASEIFVFTPKGEIKTMPQNCTALDFAFSIHTFLGSHCIGAKVNHKLVPLSHKLQSGDQVEILTSKSQHVKPEWVNYANTAKAKTKIQAILRREQRGMAQVGEDTVHQFLQQNALPDTDESLQKLCLHYDKHSLEELFVAVGMQSIVLGDDDKELFKDKSSGSAWKKFIPFSFGKGNKDEKEKTESKPAPKIDGKKVVRLTPDALQKNYLIADCCHPIPGDDVLGYLDEQDRLVIHKRQCPLAAKLKTSYGNRLVAVEWDLGKSVYFPVNIYLKGIDRIGLLNEVTQVISQQLNVNIHKLSIESNDGIFEGHIQLYVHDVEDVQVLIANLKKVNDVKFVTRTEKYEDIPN
jgi:GTP pyrophosphokinase